jgi:hypothetical protein
MYTAFYAQDEVDNAILTDTNAENNARGDLNPVKFLQWVGLLPTGTAPGTVPPPNGTLSGTELASQQAWTIISWGIGFA